MLKHSCQRHNKLTLQQLKILRDFKSFTENKELKIKHFYHKNRP